MDMVHTGTCLACMSRSINAHAMSSAVRCRVGPAKHPGQRATAQQNCVVTITTLNTEDWSTTYYVQVTTQMYSSDFSIANANT